MSAQNTPIETTTPNANEGCLSRLVSPCCGSSMRHMHDCAYGLEGAHIRGSERLECSKCGTRYGKKESAELGFKFFVD